MGRRIAIATTLAAVVFGLWAFYRLAATASRGGESNPLYSTRRYDPYGTAALRELLAERGVPARTLERPRLDAGDSGVLIQVIPLPPRFSLSRLFGRSYQVHADHLKEWIAAGNTVVQLTRAHTGLMGELGIARADGGRPGGPAPDIEKQQAKGLAPDKLRCPVAEAAWTPAGRELVAGRGGAAGPLMLRAPSGFEAGHATWRPLATVRGATVAAELRHGDGRLVVVGAPTPALNGAVDQGANLELLLALAGDGPVILDEWSHGIGHEGTIIGLIRQFGLMPVLVQVVFVLALYIWSTCGHRRPDLDELTRRRATADQIETLGYLYSQTLSSADTVARVEREVVRRVAGALRCSPEALESGNVRLGPDTAQAVERIREDVAALRAPPKAIRRDAPFAAALRRSHDFAKERSNARRRARSPRAAIR